MGESCLQTVSVRILDAGASRAADREALLAFVADRTAVDPALVRVARRCPHCGATDHGRPEALVGGRALGVSLSRAPGVLALAAGPGTVGVDVERPSRVTAAALDAFTPGERRRAAAAEASSAGSAAHLTACWAVKEAVLKRDGRGLRVDPLRVEAVLGPVTDDPSGAGHHARFAGGAEPVAVVTLDGDLVLAVAAGSAPVRVQDHRGTDAR